MLKIRLKRLGAKKAPTYRIIVINSTTKREGKPIQELGHYNPKTKEMKLDIASAQEWVKKGAQPTATVTYLMKNCDAEGKLIYNKKYLAKKIIAFSNSSLQTIAITKSGSSFKKRPHTAPRTPFIKRAEPTSIFATKPVSPPARRTPAPRFQLIP